LFKNKSLLSYLKVMKKVISIFLVLILILSGCTQPEIKPQNTGKIILPSKKDIAILISDELKNFNTIDSSALNNFEDFQNFISNVNRIIDIANENFGTDFKRIEVEEREFKKLSKTAHIVEKYTPLIGPYNELIISAKNLDPKDESSINELYVNTLFLGGDIFLINSGAIHKASFEITRELNNKLGLAAARGICGDACYSMLLSKIYQITNRAVIVGTKDKIMNWIRNETKKNN